MNIKKITDDLNSIDFANIDLQHPGQWPYLFKIFSCVFCFVVTIILGNFVYLDSIDSKEVAATLKEKQLKNEYKIKYFQSTNLVAVQQQVTDIKDMLQQIIKKLPTDTEVPSLLEDISNSAKKSGLNIDVIRLQEEKQEDYYIVLPIHISVKGDYHQFGNFVSRISNLSRLVALEDFEISKNNYDGVLRLNIVAKTYRYNKGEEN